MTILIVLFVLSLAGIGAALWFLKNDQEPDETSLSGALDLAEKKISPSPETAPEPSPDKKQKFSLLNKIRGLRKKDDAPPVIDTDEPKEFPFESKKPSIPLTSLLGKLHLGGIFKRLNLAAVSNEQKLKRKDSREKNIPTITPLPSLKEYLEKEEPAIPEHADSPPSGTASLETVPAEETAKEEMGLSGAHLSSQSAELQEKYEKLDALFKEKSADLEKTKASLDNEVKNRKDFNKVKDLLEKEIKDLRDRSHHVQLESENAKSEMEKHKKRVSQLEEKIAQLEKSLLEKERKIHDLAKQPQPPESPVKEKMDPDSPGASPSAEAASSLPEYQNKMEEATPQVSIPADIENNENQDDRFLQMSGPLGADPPGPYEEPFQDDQPMEEESFLKLQPDILSEETAKESPLADEIEQSIQSAPEPKIKPDPGSKHFPPGSTQGSGSPPKNHGQDTETNKNAKE